MKDIIEELKRISELLYSGDVEGAYELLSGVVPKLAMTVGDIEEGELRDRLTEKLRLSLSAMESNDTILLADTMQNELIEILENL